eukprot:GHVP01033409.1.p1 GENE.GHVP01033409.1~~GHVP01033409.1.p1  ORF type:complete len:111 (-),score=17.72 GHVP01033409.1:86-418(-)
MPFVMTCISFDAIISWLFMMTVALFNNPLKALLPNSVSEIVTDISEALLLRHIFVLSVLIVIFALWIFAGALIRTSTFVPFGFVAASSMFLIYQILRNAVQSRHLDNCRL